MFRTLLTTTAVAALLVTGVSAQDAAKPAAPAATASQPAAGASTNTAAGAKATFELSAGYTLSDSDHMATRIIGMKVYSSNDQNAEEIGDINDLVVDASGKAVAAIIGVGGFLGVGEKNVAVPYDQIQWATGTDGKPRLVLATTKEALKAAPDFKAPEDKGAMTPANANANGNANANAAPAPATAPAPAQAPASADNAAKAPAAGNAATTAPAPAADNAAPPAQNNAAQPAAQPNANANVPAAADANAKPDVDMSALSPLEPNALKTEDLKGIDVINSKGQIIGQIGDFVLNKDGKVDAVIVNFGGFLGIGQKEVALGLDNLQFVADKNGKRYLEANVSKEQLQNQPEYNKDKYAQERDAERLVVKP